MKNSTLTVYCTIEYNYSALLIKKKKFIIKHDTFSFTRKSQFTFMRTGPNTQTDNKLDFCNDGRKHSILQLIH